MFYLYNENTNKKKTREYFILNLIYLFIPYSRKVLFNEHIDRNYQPLPEDRPGGFNWGGEEVEPQPAPAAENEEPADGAAAQGEPAQNPQDNIDQRAARPAQN